MSDQNLAASAEARARFIRAQLPQDGLFTGHEWRISPSPFLLGEDLAAELEGLGRLLLQFNRSVNLLYRQSLAGKQPSWVAAWLDQGKPPALLEAQRAATFKNELPRVIRPDLILTESGPFITELDSVPGGIGLTAWLNQTYSAAPGHAAPVIGGANGMASGFASIFGEARNVHIVISEEAQTYRPEMAWLAGQLGGRFQVRDSRFENFEAGDAVYRFFELFDLPNVQNSPKILELAMAGQIRLISPPKPIFEEKMLFALLWNRHLREFWRQELGARFFERLQRLTPYTWMVDPAPLPPQGALPELGLTNWGQLKGLSQRERELILKVSGFSEKAWGARGVYLGSDLSIAEWSAAVDEAIAAFPASPYVLQRYHRPSQVEAQWFDFIHNQLTPMPGRVRLCPYYFVGGEGDAARASLSGVLATICPADKKIIHGMSTAILAPCSV
ncbi:MAG TPA: hypothetical protein VFC44_12035 [Candidatus Saccharimonadales bacterium]|nr:hypothetical protein [Candidatus Saccharimonadales bacterium]